MKIPFFLKCKKKPSFDLHSFAFDDGSRKMKANILFIRFAMGIEFDFSRNEMQTFCTVNDFFIASVLLPCVSDYSTFLLMVCTLHMQNVITTFFLAAFPFIALFVCYIFSRCSWHRCRPSFIWTLG